MKKSMKLLSIFLTVLMIFSSISVGAFAAKANYKTVADLEGLKAYSPYGTVTRLSTEERLSILCDSLDLLLAPMTNLNMGYLVNVNLLITKIQLYVNLTSLNEICKTLDSAASLLCGGWGTIAKGLLNLGIVEDVVLNTWNNSYKGMSRESHDHVRIFRGVMETLDDNGGLIDTVFTKGLELGMIKNFISGLDLSGINKLIVNLPALINAIVLPMFSRQDDLQAQRDKLGNTSSDLMAVAQEFVNGLFTKPMSWTSYRVGANGQDLGFTQKLPTDPEKTTRYFVISSDGNSITQYDYKYKGALSKDPAGFVETVTYTKSETEEYEGSGTYLYIAPDWYEGDNTLKWYKADGKEDNNGKIQSAYWLPSVKDAFNSGALTLEINGNDSLAGLLYKFAPYLFDEMAPVVLNGSIKKLIAGAFDVSFTKIGDQKSEAVKALASSTGDDFFTKAQEYYTWEYTDYKVIDGTPYYRYQNDYFVGEIPANISSFYGMINWNYKIEKGFMSKYIPSAVGGTSAAGYGTILEALNDFVYDLIQLFISESWEVKGQTINRSDIFQWNSGDNSKLLDNILKTARAVFMIAPEEILDEYYMDAQFYEPMMNGTLNQAVNGLICELVKLLMPQIKFADNIIDQPMLAIAAVVARELCTQLMPTYDFDAMIFSDYTGTRTMLAGKSSDYWLDTVLYMGVNLGMYYMRNLADLGEDDATNGYFGAMANAKAIPANTPDGMTFGANAQYAGDGNASWLHMVDWVIDWALSTEVEWAWQFDNLMDCGATVKLSTYENPFTKLNTIFLKLLPFDQLLNDSQVKSSTYGSNTFLENILKGGLVDSITSLNVPKLLSMLKIPNGYFTQGKIADSLVKIIVNLLDAILYKVAGGDLINKNTINSVSTLLVHKNIQAVVKALVEKLGTAYNNGLLVPILPLANFFIGWTTDPQKYAEPTSYFTNDWGSTYLKTDNNPVFKVVNTSSGMLLKHRNSDTVDKAYVISITGITFTDGVSTNAKFPVTVQPGDTADIPLTVPNASTAFKATISYKFTGKDGSALGGTQTKVDYGYVSNVNDQLNEEAGEVDKDYTVNNKYKKYEFTKDIYDSVVNYTATVSFKSSTTGLFDPSSRDPKSLGTNGKAIAAPASNYFEHISNYSEAGFVTVYKNTSDTKPGSSTGYLYKAKAGVTAETDFPYGVYDMGMTTIKYGSSGKDYEVDFIYYNDFDIQGVIEKYIGYNLKASDFKADAQSAYNAYEAALKKAVELALVAKRTDYVSTIQPQIEPAIKALEEAYEALMKFPTSSSSIGDVQNVADLLAILETNPNRDINYQDYRLFEYFKYENERTAARAMIKSVTGPEAPEAYIENDGASYAIIKATIDAANKRVTAKNKESAKAVKAALEKTVIQPDMAAYEQELANFVPAVYSDLQVGNQEAMLQYYYNFMTANKKTTVDKDFLDREIKYAEAQNYAEETYSTDSWARYTAALANAKSVYASGTNDSEVFDAKYELMVAQNNLLEKVKSMKDSGYLNYELNTVITQAQNIIQHYKDYYFLNPGVTETDAFVQLLEALGVAYNAVDGETVNNVAFNLANGDEAFTGILYNRSALTFQAYDRINSVKNKKAVDAIAEKLREATANFHIEAMLYAEDDEAIQEIDHDVNFIQGITPGTIDTVEELLEKIASTEGTRLEASVNEDGMLGTGATVTMYASDTGVALATYFVVIYGDVNGDGAVDGFDTFDLNKHMNNLVPLLHVYETAGDATADGMITIDDYSAVKVAASGGEQIIQVRNS